MSGNKEKFFCSVAQAEYEGIETLIETSLLLTPHALRVLKSSVNFYKNFTLDVIDKNLTIWEERFLNLFPSLSQVGQNDTQGSSKMAFCRAAFACTAVRESLFPASGNDPVWVNSIPPDIRNILRLNNSSNYDIFEKYVCKLSIISLMDAFKDYLINELEILLDLWLSQIGLNKIDGWISDYYAALGKTGIFENLDRLNKFMNCFFEACNFVQTAGNLKDDTAEKLQLDQVGDGWQFKSTDFINDTLNKENDLRERMNKLKNKLVILEGPKSSTGSGVSPSDVMI